MCDGVDNVTRVMLDKVELPSCSYWELEDILHQMHSEKATANQVNSGVISIWKLGGQKALPAPYSYYNGGCGNLPIII